jgi:hypothetical protein
MARAQDRAYRARTPAAGSRFAVPRSTWGVQSHPAISGVLVVRRVRSSYGTTERPKAQEETTMQPFAGTPTIGSDFDYGRALDELEQLESLGRNAEESGRRERLESAIEAYEGRVAAALRLACASGE